jgi:FlaA1/EpsC-like NDP-sugar epimerase
LALGLDHRRAVLTLYAVGFGVAAIGFASLFVNSQNTAVLLGTLLVAAAVGIWKLGYDEFAVVRSGAVLRFYNAPVLKKEFFSVFIDMAMVVAALYGAIVLKYDDWSITFTRPLAVSLIALLPATTVAVFALTKIYQRAWSSANIEDIARLAMAVLISTSAAYVLARLGMPRPAPATFFITYGLILLVLVGGGRASYRILFYMNRKSNAGGDPVVIYGAGRSGTLALREILMNSKVPMRPIGFIDDDPSKRGRVVNGYPVLGDVDSLAAVIMNRQAVGVVVASQKISIANVRRAKQLCDDHGGWLRSFRVDFRTITSEYRLPIETQVPPRPVA